MDTYSVSGRYWSKEKNGKIRCELCPRYCKLQEGQKGLCFVRERQNNEIVLTTYGRSSGFCVDPIEKKPLNHFLPGTPVLSFGTAGCNLTCKFCQNWDISKSRETNTLAHSASPKVIAKAAYELGCSSVAFTYNDPIIFLEYAVDVAKECHLLGIKTVAVTAGEICEKPREEFFEHIDAANVDLKAFTQRFYKEICTGSLQTVLETLLYLKNKTNVWLETTTLLIPGENDSAQEISEMTNWVVANLGPDVPMHFTAFHPDWKMRDKPRTPIKTLIMAKEIALKNGVHYAYTGNVHDEKGGSTICHKCKNELIVRDWFILKKWHLDEKGLCQKCGAKCKGIFQEKPGTWGDRRLPVQLKNYC